MQHTSIFFFLCLSMYSGPGNVISNSMTQQNTILKLQMVLTYIKPAVWVITWMSDQSVHLAKWIPTLECCTYILDIRMTNIRPRILGLGYECMCAYISANMVMLHEIVALTALIWTAYVINFDYKLWWNHTLISTLKVLILRSFSRWSWKIETNISFNLGFPAHAVWCVFI